MRELEPNGGTRSGSPSRPNGGAGSGPRSRANPVATRPGSPPMRLGYVFTELPNVAGMFPNAEIEAMGARGAAIEIFVLRGRSRETDETRRLERTYPVHRSPYLFSLAVAGDWLAAGLRHPVLLGGIIIRTVLETCRSPRVLVKSLAILPKSVHFARLAKRRRVTLVHAYWAHLPALAASVMARLSGLEFTTWAHAGGDIYQRTYQTEAALRARLRQARAVLTCNRANVEYFQTLAPADVLARMHLLTHGIDLAQFQPASRPKGKTEPAILAVGGFAPAKGHRHLIEACRLLAREGRRFRCLLAGTGSLEEAVRRQVHEAGLDERVRFLGQVPHERLPALYGESDLFVMPSVIGPAGSRDGLPNVLLEAMACGLPSVGSDIASIPEVIIEGKTGLLVAPGDPEALAAAIGRLLSDEGLRLSLGEAAARLVRAHYGREPAMDALFGIFRSLHAGAALVP